MTDFGPPPGTFPVPPTPPTPPPPPPSAVRLGPPWENPGAPLQRFIDTAKGVLIDPMTTFAQMRREGGLQAPLFYYLLGMAIGFGVSFLWATIGIGGMGMPGRRLDEASMGIAMFALFFLLIVPICCTIGIFIGAGITHLLLSLFGGANHSYETTFRTLAYTHGSALPILLLPFCGQYIAGIWATVVLIIGLSQMHETSIGKAAAAVLVPFVICCALGAIFIGTIMAMIGMAAATAASGVH
jgi:hypothetical protein